MEPTLLHCHGEGRATDGLRLLVVWRLRTVANAHGGRVAAYQRGVVRHTICPVAHVLNGHPPVSARKEDALWAMHIYEYLVAARLAVVATRVLGLQEEVEPLPRLCERQCCSTHSDRVCGDSVDEEVEVDHVGRELAVVKGNAYHNLTGATRLEAG
eukprot:scaffold141986_cov29-Tisochrysis_lutea.AAC.13